MTDSPRSRTGKPDTPATREPATLSVDSAADARRLIQNLVEAGLALSSALSLDRVLQVLVNVARELVNARYAALGVLSADGTGLAEFVTAGLSEEERKRIGESPMGRGILGLLIKEPRPLRLRDLRQHAASAGVPQNHPHMSSFLGVPITAKGHIFGNLYVTDKVDGDEFSENDLALIETLAAQAAVAIENAQLRQQRDRFFAAASHELGNAVAGIQVWARHLLQRSSDAPDWLRDGLGKVLKGADGAHKLIDDLLSLAKIQEGRLSLSPWPVDVREPIEEALMQQRPNAEAAGLTLTSDVGSGFVVETDPARVRQILVNLITNAIKFSQPQGRIVVGATRNDAGDVIISVRDAGPGVAAQDAERIFQPYEQVSGLARGRGAGLGLPLSRQLARLMGGDLWVDPGENGGAVFKLRLQPKMPATNVKLEARMFEPAGSKLGPP